MCAFFVRMSFWQLFSSYMYVERRRSYEKFVRLTLMKLYTCAQWCPSSCFKRNALPHWSHSKFFSSSWTLRMWRFSVFEFEKDLEQSLHAWKKNMIYCGFVHEWRHTNLDNFWHLSPSLAFIGLVLSTVVTRSWTSLPKTVTSYVDDPIFQSRQNYRWKHQTMMET